MSRKFPLDIPLVRTPFTNQVATFRIKMKAKRHSESTGKKKRERIERLIFVHFVTYREIFLHFLTELQQQQQKEGVQI